MNLDNALWLAIGAGVLAILYGLFSVRWILAQPAGNPRMQGRRQCGRRGS